MYVKLTSKYKRSMLKLSKSQGSYLIGTATEKKNTVIQQRARP